MSDLRELFEALADPEVTVALKRRAMWQRQNGGYGAAYRLEKLVASLPGRVDDYYAQIEIAVSDAVPVTERAATNERRQLHLRS